jgi:SHS2 domain-containing protein
MPYKYFDEIAIADVAFEATGSSLPEMFAAAADALMNVMVEDLVEIKPQIEHPFKITSETMDMLLFNFLQELIFLKDAKQLLLRAVKLEIKTGGDKFELTGTLTGEPLEALRHPLNVDVKAVTLHRFKVEESAQGWSAFVVLDI